MNVERLWCRICNKMVEAGIEEAAASLALPALGGLAGGALGSKRGGGGGFSPKPAQKLLTDSEAE